MSSYRTPRLISDVLVDREHAQRASRRARSRARRARRARPGARARNRFARCVRIELARVLVVRRARCSKSRAQLGDARRAGSGPRRVSAKPAGAAARRASSSSAGRCVGRRPCASASSRRASSRPGARARLVGIACARRSKIACASSARPSASRLRRAREGGGVVGLVGGELGRARSYSAEHPQAEAACAGRRSPVVGSASTLLRKRCLASCDS